MTRATAMARELLHGGFCAMSILDGSAPSSIIGSFWATAHEIASGLNAEDRSGDLVGYAALFTRGGPMTDEHIAAAKVLLAVEDAARAIWDDRYIRQDWSGSRLAERTPKLRALLDEDGLLPARAFDEALPDAFRIGREVVHLSELVANPLARTVCGLAGARPETVAFQPAHFHVEDADAYREQLWEDFVYGPAFNFDDFRRRRLYGKPEPVELRRYPRDHIEELFDRKDPVVAVQVTRTERRDARDPISLLIESLVPPAPKGFTRTTIFHCDIRPDGETFIHADASMLLYDGPTYARRLAAPIGERVKAQGHHKLFKVTNVALPEWTELLVRSFPRNELIVEYLRGERQPIGPAARPDLPPSV